MVRIYVLKHEWKHCYALARVLCVILMFFFSSTDCRLKELCSPDNEKKKQQQRNYKSSSQIIPLKIVVSFVSLSIRHRRANAYRVCMMQQFRWFISYWISTIFCISIASTDRKKQFIFVSRYLSILNREHQM